MIWRGLIRIVRQVIKTSALFLAVLAFCTVTLKLFPNDHVIAAVWVLNAVILAFVLRGATGFAARSSVLAAAGVAMIAASLICGRPLSHSLEFAGANVAEVAIAAWLLRRTPNPMASPRAFALFVAFGVLAAPIVSGGLVSLFTVLVDHDQHGLSAPKWIMSDALGMLILGPFTLSVRAPKWRRPIDLRAIGFAVAGQLLVLGAATAILMQAATPPVFMIFPVLVIGALSHRKLGGVLAVLNVTIVAVVCTYFGRGPAVVAKLTHHDTVFVMQVMLATLVLTVLPVTALLRKLDHAAAELERRRADAEDLSEIKTKLLAHVSHEIRSPLSGVTSLAELMRDGVMGDLTPHQRDTLSQIAASGSEVEALARDLLDAATLQSGKASVHLSDIDVEDAVETAVTAARFRAKDFGGSVVVVGGYAGELKVAADRLRLRQILINLIVNGLKYGGRPPLVQIAAFATDHGTIRFEVSDNGTGVSADQREMMFRSFDRLGAEKSDIEGAGLGLALSRELALLQHGRLGVDDSDLGGARFWLELPCWREAEDAAAA